MHSQTLSTSKDTLGRYITNVQRDSAFFKIQRGKINAERVGILVQALSACDSAKVIYTEVIDVQDMKVDSLFLVVKKERTINNNLREINKDERKVAKKKQVKSFFTGTAVGVAIMAILTVVL